MNATQTVSIDRVPADLIEKLSSGDGWPHYVGEPGRDRAETHAMVRDDIRALIDVTVRADR